MAIDDEDDSDISDFFPAKISAVNLVSGVNYYTWVEQNFDSDTGAYSDAPGGRSGNSTTSPFLVEINNSGSATLPSFVWARLRGIVNGDTYYEFAVEAIPAPTITVREVDQGSICCRQHNRVPAGRQFHRQPTKALALLRIDFQDCKPYRRRR